MGNVLAHSKEKGEARARELGHIFIEDGRIRNYFWIEVLANKRDVFEIAEWFFNQDSQLAERFTDLSLVDIMIVDANKPMTDQNNGLQQFLGLIADFQAAHPGHTNLEVIRQKVNHFAEETGFSK